MALHRRDFIKWTLVQATLSGLPDLTVASSPRVTPSRNRGPSILQGATDETQTQFSILHDPFQQLVCHVVDGMGRTQSPDTQSTRFPGYGRSSTKLFFSGLRPREPYQLVVIDGSTGSEIDRRDFSTLSLGNPKTRFAICSCMDDMLHEPEIWRDLVRAEPDVIFFIGDAVYVNDRGYPLPINAEVMWRRFGEARSTLDIFYSRRLIPIIATWDDHDCGNNDVIGSAPYLADSQRNFLEFFAQENLASRAFVRGPGVSSAFKMASHLFLLLDDRSWRLTDGSRDRYAHWGAEQEQWALSQIRTHQGPVWVMNGTQIVPAAIWKDSVSRDHPVQWRGLQEELRRLDQRVIFATGDVHFSEISRLETALLGYPSYEITSSAVHSRPLPGMPGIVPNHRRLAATAAKNYVLVESRANGFHSTAIVQSRSAGGVVNFMLQIDV